MLFAQRGFSWRLRRDGGCLSRIGTDKVELARLERHDCRIRTLKVHKGASKATHVRGETGRELEEVHQEILEDGCWI